jgi:hypothetical protein
LTKESRGEVAQIVKTFQLAGYTLDDLRNWWTNVWLKDWRSKQGRSRPTTKQLRDNIGQVKLGKELPNALVNSGSNDNLPEYDPKVWEDINF